MATITEKKLHAQRKKLLEKQDNLGKSGDLQKYLIYLGTSEAKKEVWRKEWEDYYEECRQSPAAELYRQMSIACRNKDTAKIKELMEANQAMIDLDEWIPEPDCIDVIEMEMNPKFKYAYDQYERIKRDIARIDDELKTYSTPIGIDL